MDLTIVKEHFAKARKLHSIGMWEMPPLDMDFFESQGDHNLLSLS